jgi:hypothetical protein
LENYEDTGTMVIKGGKFIFSNRMKEMGIYKIIENKVTDNGIKYSFGMNCPNCYISVFWIVEMTGKFTGAFNSSDKDRIYGKITGRIELKGSSLDVKDKLSNNSSFTAKKIQ